jgi:hypothetical protein
MTDHQNSGELSEDLHKRNDSLMSVDVSVGFPDKLNAFCASAARHETGDLPLLVEFPSSTVDCPQEVI